MPPELSDFPHDVQRAIISFSKYPSNIVPDVGYLGKNFSQLNLIAKLEHVIDKDLYLQTLLKMDKFYIEKSQKDLEESRKTK